MTHLETVIRHLRRTVDLEDAHLLTSFIDQKDEAAFASLVKRHGPMVWGVCRRLLNHHIAEDAFQLTFLVLARKARSVRPREMAANWLHGVAYRTALQARTTYLKQQVREKQVAKMPEPEAAPQEYSDLHAVIDRELIALPDRYRLPIVLCDLGDKSIKEAARQLGWPQGTLAGRLFRARKLLATRLARRGLAISGGSLMGLSHEVSAAIPVSLIGATVKAASLQAVPAKIAALMEGVMTAMLITKLKTAAVVLLVLVAVGVGGGLLSHSTSAQTAPALGEQVKAPVTPYKAAFARALAVMGEHFEEITHANLYEGRIEACTVQPDKKGLLRQAVVSFSYDGGNRLIDVHINKLKGTDVIGRDTDMERAIEAQLPKERNAQQGVPTLKGAWRVVSVTGGERAFDVYRHTDLVFVGERMLVVPNDPNDTGPATVYRVHLGASRPVQEIDLYQKAADETRTLGIYEVRKDELRLCLSNRRGTRPTNFEASKTQAVLVARRIVETTAAEPIYLMRFLDGGTVPKTEE
jgi:RNA polymerase sigma factor (sigma-70 family)